MKIKLLSGSIGFVFHPEHPELQIIILDAKGTWFEVEGQKGPHQFAHNVELMRRRPIIGALDMSSDGWVEMTLLDNDVESSCNCEDSSSGPLPAERLDFSEGSIPRCTTCGGKRYTW